MIPMRASKRVIRTGDDELVISTTAGRRFLYFGCFLLLLGAFAFNVDLRTDFTPPELRSTLFVIVLMLVSLGLAGWSTQWIVRKGEKRVTHRKLLAWIPAYVQNYDFASTGAADTAGEAPLAAPPKGPRAASWEIKILDLNLSVSEAGRKPNTPFLRRFNDLRTGIHAVALSGAPGNIVLAESSDIHEILPIAKALEAFLGMASAREQM